jgi:2-keto-4-pentenoate hydratase/2-oxohepta-3-ene-1,7-dioic acid hydratase in catechol pathway
MRLVTYSNRSKKCLGAVKQNHIIDLHAANQYVYGANSALSPLSNALQTMTLLLESGEECWDALHNLYQIISEDLSNETNHFLKKRILIPYEDVQLLAPFSEPGKIICIAGNYPSLDNDKKPDYPTVFLKPSSTVTGPGMPIRLSELTKDVAIEVELGIVIRKQTRHVSIEESDSSIAGYILANDVGDRVLEKRTTQWTSGKMFDTFTPLGPWLVTKDEILTPENLEMMSIINGKVIQKGNTADMFFDCKEIISILSDLTTLQPGDIILTGSPKCIEKHPNPEISLSEGDLVTIKIGGLGQLSNPVQKEL